MSEQVQEFGTAAGWPSAALAGIRAELARDLGFFVVIGAYLTAAVAMALAIGRPSDLVVFAYVPYWLSGAILLGFLAITVVDLPRSVRAAPASPLTHLMGAVRRRLNPRLAAGLLLFTAIALFYGAFTSIKSMLPHAVPFGFDGWAADMDARLHGGHDPWRLLQPILGHHAVTRFIQFLYMPGWTFMLFAATAAVCVSRRLQPVRGQFLCTYLMIWPLVGNVLAGAAMSAGPAYFGLVTGEFGRYAEQLRYLSFSEGLLNSSFDLQGRLWASYASGKAGLGSGISAFPSMHVAMATLYVLAARRIHPRLAAAAAAFAALILAGSVHLGWHYAIDGYASAAITVAVWTAVGFWTRSREAGATGAVAGHRGR